MYWRFSDETISKSENEMVEIKRISNDFKSLIVKCALSYRTINLMFFSTVMHQSIPPAPSSPPGDCGAFASLVSPGDGAFANFALPGGRAFANPRAIPELLTRTQFPIRI